RFPDLTGYGCNAADKGEVSAAEFAALVNGRKAIDYRVTLWFILSKVTCMFKTIFRISRSFYNDNIH
ncbi:hypothetical protein, partial [Clostridium sp. AM42-4]